MVSVRIGRFNEDRFSVGGKSKQNLLLRFKRANAVRSAVHQRQVVLVRQKHGRNEDRFAVGGRSKEDLLLRFKRANAVRPAIHQRQVVLVRQEHGRNEDRFSAD